MSFPVPFESNSWQAFIVDHTQRDWGDLQPYLQIGKLNGAIIIGIDDRRWELRDLAHKIISLIQKLKGWIEGKDFKEGKVIDDLSFAQHAAIINGPLQLTKDQKILLKNRIKTLRSQREDLKKKPQSRNVKKKLLELKTEINRRKNYLYLDEKTQEGTVEKIMVTDAGHPGIRTVGFTLGKDNVDKYTKLVILVPPENIARRVKELSQVSALHELEELSEKGKEKIPFHYKQVAITPFIRSTPSSAKMKRRINDSTARAVVDLIKGRPIRKKTGKGKQMICSELVTRLMQAAIVCEELGDENIEKLRNIDDKLAAKIVERWIPEHPILKMRAAATMPYHLVSLSSNVNAVVYDVSSRKFKRS